MDDIEVDTFEHAGLTVRILAEQYDTEWANPRGNDGNLGVMFCDYRDYSLGDKDAPDPRGQTITCPNCKGEGEDPKLWTVVDRAAYGYSVLSADLPSRAAAERNMRELRRTTEHAEARLDVERQSCSQCEGEGEVEATMVEYLQREHGARVILPLFVYEHSGITMRTGGRLDTGEDDLVSRGRFPLDGAGWDTSTVGMIFDTTEARKECGVADDITDDDIERQLDEEVRYYAAYLEGEVYYYTVENAEGEVLDSCGGFLDPDLHKDDSYTKQEARSAAEAAAEAIKRENTEREAMAARDIITT